MDKPIKFGNGILEQIKQTYITVTITKREVFNALMGMFKEFYEEYPYAIKWDYEKFTREMLDYYE